MGANFTAGIQKHTGLESTNSTKHSRDHRGQVGDLDDTSG